MLMKIHFIVPPAEKPVDRIYGCNYAFFLQHNVMLLTIATYLKEKRFDIEITDCVIDGIPVEGIKDDADAYVIYSVALTRADDLAAAKLLEKKGKPIIFMGPDPTWSPKDYLKSGQYLVVRGEPEITLLVLLENLKNPKKVRGVSYLAGKKVVDNPPRQYITNLDELPVPDRTLLKNPLKYFNSQFKKSPQTTILTSRGCAYRCYYCVPNSLDYARELEWKRFYHKKPPVMLDSAEKVIREFGEIYRLGYRGIKIIDDQFVWNKERMLKICGAIKKYDFEIACLARADHLVDEEIVKALSGAGVKYIDIGIESFNQEILDYIRKDVKVETFYKAVENLRKYGIEPEVNILLGACPLETKETIQHTLEEAKKLNVPVVHAKICAAFPGTDFYYEAKKNGWITTKDYIPHDASKETYTSYPHLPAEYLQKTVNDVYLKHYFSPRFLFNQMVHLKSLKEFREKAETALRILFR